MTNLTKSREDKRQEGILIDVVLAPNAEIFAGSNVSFNAAGLAKKASDTTGETFAGLAMEHKNSANGDTYIRVWREGVSSMNASGATQAWVGQKVYAVDDNVVALGATTTNDVVVGTVVGFVSPTEVRVKI